MAASIGVIDYGMGNLHSLGKALERVSSASRVVISYDPEELMACDLQVWQGLCFEFQRSLPHDLIKAD